MYLNRLFISTMAMAKIMAKIGNYRLRQERVKIYPARLCGSGILIDLEANDGCHSTILFTTHNAQTTELLGFVIEGSRLLTKIPEIDDTLLKYHLPITREIMEVELRGTKARIKSHIYLLSPENAK